MIKSGYYALYKGQEYFFTRHMETRELYICTYDKNLIDDTFVKSNGGSGLYEKIVHPFDLDDVYRITTYAYVEGNRQLGVRKETENMVLVFTNGEDKDLIEKFHLEEVDRGVFQGWISKDEVQLVEERKDMTRQFGVIKRSTDADSCLTKEQ